MREHRALVHLLCLLSFLVSAAAYGDEQVRQTQEELRKRNLYFGDVDGQFSAELANALRRYQRRKGFSITGTIDEETASSLSVLPPTLNEARQAEIPNLPILRSDVARQLPRHERVALEKEAEEENPNLPPSPPPPAEAPPASQNIAPQRIQKLVEDYLRDGETEDIAAQTRYFSYPLDYFDHGMKGANFVERDVRNYVKRWPQRKYYITKPVSFRASEKDGETIVEFPIAYDLHRPKYSAKGQTNNTWTIRPEGNELKIISIHEERIRPGSPAVAE